MSTHTAHTEAIRAAENLARIDPYGAHTATGVDIATQEAGIRRDAALLGLDPESMTDEQVDTLRDYRGGAVDVDEARATLAGHPAAHQPTGWSQAARQRSAGEPSGGPYHWIPGQSDGGAR